MNLNTKLFAQNTIIKMDAVQWKLILILLRCSLLQDKIFPTLTDKFKRQMMRQTKFSFIIRLYSNLPYV